MRMFACPSCGAEVPFRSSLSVYAVCAYCNSMVVRRDVDVEAIGTMAALPEDMSPLQIGTEGVYQGVRFSLVGRLKIGWEAGAWNEWFIVSDDSRKGWLAEAQGFYAVSYELAVPDSLPEANSLNINDFITLEGDSLRVVDIKDATCIGSEGELPFIAPKGRKTRSIDLLGAHGEFASIEIEHKMQGNTRLYVGNYVAWDDLKLSHLRELEGW